MWKIEIEKKTNDSTSSSQWEQKEEEEEQEQKKTRLKIQFNEFLMMVLKNWKANRNTERRRRKTNSN